METSQLPLILIAAHGNLGAELLKSAEIIIGKQDRVECISLLPGMDLEDFAGLFREALGAAEGNAIILCDLFGGTPSNVTAGIGLEGGAIALTGVNLPMLIEACMSRGEQDRDALRRTLIEAGQGGCTDLAAEMEKIEI